ncbi:hypothetical protein EST38_g9170 [Candolleomyces aberdarensis]|uniref:Uncharacterized protein n=1 Tax=Candolleomyces aberdarensis TaxID=2316362 RepID=A0A4Q2DDI7_9AGAR|nr:hypothetical protein EST38_g9170 [Candolleomyces aberdarensis]
MSNPFTLMGMARRATQNFRQMTYGSTAPSTPAAAATPSTSDDNKSDTASIASATKRQTSSPLLQTRKPSLPAVDNVNVTSSPAASPPAAAKAVLSDVASNGSSTTLAMQEPTSVPAAMNMILSESPRMEPVELSKSPGSIDYFSLQPRKSSEESTSTKVNQDDSEWTAVIDELKLQKKRLEDQVQLLTSEKQRVAGDLETLTGEKKRLGGQVKLLTDEKQRVAGDLESATHENQRLERKLQEKQRRWDEEQAASIAERDQERGQLEQEKASLAKQVRDLTAEKEGLIEQMAQKQAQWDQESERMAEEVVREMDILSNEKQELEGRVAALESTVGEKEKAEKKLEGAVAVLKKEQGDNARTMAAQQQYLVAARDELKGFQAQATKEIQASTAETRRLSQQLRNEKEARNVERAQVSKERSDEQQRFEAEKRSLAHRVSGLEQVLEAKEKARKRLEDDIAIVKREKDESSRVVASLQQQLTSAKEATKKLQEAATARVSSLQKDLDSLREDREKQIASRDSQINVINANLDEAKRERGSLQETVKRNNGTISQLNTDLIQRNHLFMETEKEMASLRERFLVIGDELEGKELEVRSLEVGVTGLTKERDEKGRMVASLQEQLTLAAGEMKMVNDTTTAKIIGLEEELRRMREEREAYPCMIM